MIDFMNYIVGTLPVLIVFIVAGLLMREVINDCFLNENEP